MLTDVQREWHRKGLNGCVFARLAARSGDWRSHVVRREPLEVLLQGALNDPACEVLSLLFPAVTELAQVVGLSRQVAATPGFRLSHVEVSGSLTAVSLRADVGAEAWIMGFGPFECFPATRRAPVTELVVRVKPKGDWLYEKHSHDRDVAHVADIPLSLHDAAWDSLWDATHAATRAVLQGEPDVFSAARTTFTVPSELW